MGKLIWRKHSFSGVLAGAAFLQICVGLPQGYAQPAPGYGDTPPLAEPIGPGAPPAEAPRVPPGPPAPGPAAPAPGPAPGPAPVRAEAAGYDGDPRLDAERDAEMDISSGGWLIAGCLLSVYAVAAAYFVDSSPPYTRFIGKGERYLAIYIPTYRQAAGDLRLRYSVYGCLGAFVATAGFVLLTATLNGNNNNNNNNNLE